MRATLRLVRRGAVALGGLGALGAAAAVACDGDASGSYAARLEAAAQRLREKRDAKAAADDARSASAAPPSEVPLPPGQADARPPLYDPASLVPDVPVAVHNSAIVSPGGREALMAGGQWDGHAGSDDKPPAALPAPGSVEDALYALKTLRPGLTFVCTHDEAVEATHAIGVVAVTRGCHPAVSEAVHASLAAAAKADGAGLVWYVVTDATPEPVVQALEDRLGISIERSYYEGRVWPPVAGAAASASDADVEGALPTVLLADRYKVTHRKYVLPLAGAAAASDAAVAAAAAPLTAAPTAPPPLPEQVRFLLSAAVPTPASLAAWTADFLRGGLQPTLLGAARPAGDVHPAFPFLHVVTSSSFSDVVLDPRHDVAVEAYLSDCPMCMALGARVRMAAYLAHRFFPSVRVGVMNVDDNERPRQWMPGPAFPTIQLFNGGAGPAAKAGGQTKLGGPACPHHNHGAGGHSHAAATATAEDDLPPVTAAAGGGGSRKRRAVGNAPSGSPPCVPSLDFRHPTSPGRQALPSVGELVAWLGANATFQFDPDAVHVPASEVLDAARRFPDYAQALGVAPVVPEAAAAEGGAGAPAAAAGPATVPLSALCDDMEVEARVLETGVFQTFWFSSVAEQYAKTFRLEGGGGSEGESALPPVVAARDAELAPTRAAKLAAFKRLAAAARSVVVEHGMYGRGDAAEGALDACDEHLAATGMLAELKGRLRDEAEADTERRALGAALHLLS